MWRETNPTRTRGTGVRLLGADQDLARGGRTHDGLIRTRLIIVRHCLFLLGMDNQLPDDYPYPGQKPFCL
jgi:hypothetical protein